ncbi:MAG: hypothetical protein U0528_01745 [Anaerolineae bacterium]
MAAKARANGVRFRPHFKTHQSADVGAWFRDEGVSAITASSLRMASYFADHGWSDITVGVPVNIREIDLINALAARIELGVLVDSLESVTSIRTCASADQRVDRGRSGLSAHGRCGNIPKMPLPLLIDCKDQNGCGCVVCSRTRVISMQRTVPRKLSAVIDWWSSA